MLFNDQNFKREKNIENVFPFSQLQQFVERLLKSRVNKFSDVQDISQNVFKRSWQWSYRHDKKLSLDEWKKLIARISFNEINRFYSKKSDLLLEDLLPENTSAEIVENTINPQFILEIAEELHNLAFRQKLAIVLHEAEILPYLKIVLSDNDIAKLLEISVETLASLESEIPLSETQIIELIESVTQKPCKSSIRDERSKGRKLLRRRLFGI